MNKLNDMDYKFIYQLLERYWKGETSLSEERLLCDFFAGDSVPDELRKYCSWFGHLNDEALETLSPAAEQKIEARFGRKKKRVVWQQALRACYHVAACGAILFCVALGARELFAPKPTVEEVTFNYSSYQDAAVDPQAAYEQVYGSLQMLSSGLRDAGVKIDSLDINHNI